MHLDLPSMLYTNQYNRSRAGRLVVIHLSLLFIDRVEPVIIAAADTASADTASAQYDLSHEGRHAEGSADVRMCVMDEQER